EENPTFPDLRYQRARIYERSGRTDEAIADLERALAEHPHYVEAHLLLAVCWAARADRERAVAALGEALALGLEAPEWLTPDGARDWTREQWRRLLERRPEARAEAAAASPHSAGPAPPLEEALAREQAGDLHGAIQALSLAVTERPGYADLR